MDNDRKPADPGKPLPDAETQGGGSSDPPPPPAPTPPPKPQDG